MPPFADIALSIFLLAALFALLSVPVGRRFAGVGITTLWLVAAASASSVIVLRSHRLGPRSPLEPTPSLFFFGLALMLATFGPTALFMTRQVRSAAPVRVRTIVLGSSLAFFGLLAAIFVGFILEMTGVPAPRF
jgi:hypothetical protein